MDAAQLFNIDDADQLRSMLLEKLEELAARDAMMTRQESLIAERDAVIAAWTSAVDKRDEIIRNRDITIEALTYEIAPATSAVRCALRAHGSGTARAVR